MLHANIQHRPVARASSPCPVDATLVLVAPATHNVAWAARPWLLFALFAFAFTSHASAAEPRQDPRLAYRTLYQGSGFTPPKSLDEWNPRAKYLREQVMIAAGLHPLPDKTPLNPVIHGKVERPGYTVEKVFFQSHPDFYVTGNLYRPAGRQGPFPAVLCPHGHWSEGRLHRANDKEVAKQLQRGWETDENCARFPLQARCANLARLGCVVFFYDMVGYADADPTNFPHRKTYLDLDSDLRSISVFGLQTWNSIRALDFVTSLPDVDKSRVACTGASGGGTQTFILMNAEPERLKVAAPVCMISHHNHQGGCVCENNSHLRYGTDNVELAATFAPKPLVHPSTAGDWTKEFMTRGYPELQSVYSLFNAKDNVFAMIQDAEHNYNKRSREAVYNFFNTHLKLNNPGPIAEQTFTPIDPKDLVVFTAEHPRPAASTTPDKLKAYLIEQHQKHLTTLKPADLQNVLRHILHTDLPKSATLSDGAITRGDGVSLPVSTFKPAADATIVTLLFHPDGRARAETGDRLVPGLTQKGHVVIAVDVFLTGSLRPAALPDKSKVEFPAGYNRTTLANRAHDILTAVAAARNIPGIRHVNVVAVGELAPAALLARAVAPDAISKLAIDHLPADFDKVADRNHPMYLPAALRFGGLWNLASPGAPAPLLVLDTDPATVPTVLQQAYKTTYPESNLTATKDPNALIPWLTK